MSVISYPQINPISRIVDPGITEVDDPYNQVVWLLNIVQVENGWRLTEGKVTHKDNVVEKKNNNDINNNNNNNGIEKHTTEIERYTKRRAKSVTNDKA